MNHLAMKTLKRISAQPVVLVVALTLFYFAAWSGRVHRYGDNPTALIGFGCHPSIVCFARENISLLPSAAVVFLTGGYDGQFYYYIASRIFRGRRAVVDAREFRWSRIGLPLLLGWTLLPGADFAVRALPLSLFLAHLGVVLLLFFALRRSSGNDSENDHLRATLLFAFNPFTLLSLLLCVSDGLALDLAVAGMVLYDRQGRSVSRPTGLLVAAWLFSGLALLTKETMLAVPVSGLVVALIRLRCERTTASLDLIFWSSVIVPLVAWWISIGYSPLFAARRGGFPLQGLWSYLTQPDALISPRSILVVLLPLIFMLGIQALFGWAGGRDRFRGRALVGISGPVFLMTGLLVALATAEEYWSNLPNIARLFTPAVAGAAIGPLEGRRIAPARRRAQALLLFLFVLMDGLLLWRELTGSSMPFEIWSF